MRRYLDVEPEAFGLPGRMCDNDKLSHCELERVKNLELAIDMSFCLTLQGMDGIYQVKAKGEEGDYFITQFQGQGQGRGKNSLT